MDDDPCASIKGLEFIARVRFKVRNNLENNARDVTIASIPNTQLSLPIRIYRYGHAHVTVGIEKHEPRIAIPVCFHDCFRRSVRMKKADESGLAFFVHSQCDSRAPSLIYDADSSRH